MRLWFNCWIIRNVVVMPDQIPCRAHSRDHRCAISRSTGTFDLEKVCRRRNKKQNAAFFIKYLLNNIIIIIFGAFAGHSFSVIYLMCAVALRVHIGINSGKNNGIWNIRVYVHREQIILRIKKNWFQIVCQMFHNVESWWFSSHLPTSGSILLWLWNDFILLRFQ